MVVVLPAQQLPAFFIEDLGMLFHLLFDQHFEVFFLFMDLFFLIFKFQIMRDC